MITSGSRGWALALSGNAVIGALGGIGWPFVYFMGYTIAAEAGWIVGDPTVTDDGAGLPIALGSLVLLVVVGLFAALNMTTRGRGRLPVAVAVCALTGVAVAIAAYPY